MDIPSLLEKSLLIALGAIGTVAWYFWRRKVEGKAALDHIDKNERLLRLKQSLDTSGLSVADLRSFEQLLFGKVASSQAVADTFARQADSLRSFAQEGDLTQLQMEEASLRTHHLTRADLETTVAELRSLLDEEETELFDKSYAAWESYLDSYSNFVGKRYEGGSIHTLMVLSALEGIMAAQIANLATEIADRKL